MTDVLCNLEKNHTEHLHSEAIPNLIQSGLGKRSELVASSMLLPLPLFNDNIQT